KVDRGRWQQTIRRRGAEHDDVELTRLNACLFHRLARRRGGDGGRALGLGDVPLLDAGSLDDPLVGRVDADRREVEIRHHGGRQTAPGAGEVGDGTLHAKTFPSAVTLGWRAPS